MTFSNTDPGKWKGRCCSLYLVWERYLSGSYHFHAFVMANFRVRGRISKMSLGHLVPESKQEQNDGDSTREREAAGKKPAADAGRPCSSVGRAPFSTNAVDPWACTIDINCFEFYIQNLSSFPTIYLIIRISVNSFGGYYPILFILLSFPSSLQNIIWKEYVIRDTWQKSFSHMVKETYDNKHPCFDLETNPIAWQSPTLERLRLTWATQWDPIYPNWGTFYKVANL